MHCVAQHLRAMADFSTYRSDDPSEDPQPPERISGGTLLWMCYTRDALSAALAGRPCSLSPEDLACFSDLLAVEPNQDEILSSVSSDIPPLLSGLGVVSTFRHLTTAIRDCTISVTGRESPSSHVRARVLSQALVPSTAGNRELIQSRTHPRSPRSSPPSGRSRRAARMARD